MVKKIISRFLIFLAILWLPLYWADRFYTKQIPKKIDEKAIWILSKKNGNYDYALIGSSRAFNVLSVIAMDSCLGFNGINLGISGADYAENYLCLKKFIENGNRIHYLLIQVDLYGIVDPQLAYSHPFNDQNYVYLIGDPSVDSIMYANTNSVKHVFRKYIPFFRYAEYNSIYPIDKVVSGFKFHLYDFDKTKGSMLSSNQATKGATPLPQPKQNSPRPVYQASCDNLMAIVKLARNNNTKVIFFTSPVYKPLLLRNNIEFGAAHNKIVSLSKNANIIYFDFEKSDLCRDSTLFKDYSHLNANGAVLFSQQLADSTKKAMQMIK